jgi:hypothetical protein
MRKHGRRAQEREVLVNRTIMLSMRDAQYKRIGATRTFEWDGEELVVPGGRIS